MGCIDKYVDAWWMCVLNVVGKLTISTSDNLDIERTYMDTPTVTEGPENWFNEGTHFCYILSNGNCISLPQIRHVDPIYPKCHLIMIDVLVAGEGDAFDLTLAV